jgi:cytochrome c-type biogenesis protein CcmH
MSSIASKTIALLFLFAIGGSAFGAATEGPALEKRVTALASELRCLVCQNQSLADSNAGLAVDLKNQIRERMQQGQDESQIVDFMVARYGDFVLYRPPFKASTLGLWLGPLVLLLAGFLLLYRLLKTRSARDEVELTATARARAARLLAPDNERNAT